MARFAGIDVQERSVRVAVVRTSYRKVAIEQMIEVPFGTDEASAVTAAMVGVKADGIAVSLSGDRVFYRRLELPMTAQREIENVLGFELESTVPFEMEDAVFDHRVLKKSGTGSLTVFSALAKTTDVKSRIDFFKAAIGREPDMVGAGAVSLVSLTTIIPSLDSSILPPKQAAAAVVDEAGDRATPLPMSPNAPIALLDMGETKSELLLLVGGEPAFARTLSRGTAGLPSPEAAQALLGEVSRTFGAWRAQGGEAVRKLFLVGLGASVSGAEHYFSTTLRMPVARIPIPMLEGVKPEDADKPALFGKAIALALSLDGRSKGLDLRQGPLGTARSYTFVREKIPLLSGLAAVILVSFAFSVISELRALSSEKEGLVLELKSTTKEVFGEETADMTRARELLEKGPAAADDDPMPGADVFDVMVQYSKSVPKDIVHDVLELDANRGHITITGIIPKDVDGAATTDAIISGMKENPCFKDVKVQKVTQFGADKQKYALELDIKCDDGKKKDDKKKTDASAADTSKPAEKGGDK